MTDEQKARETVEDLARRWEDYVLGYDAIRYKGLDEELVRLLVAAVAAERERIAAELDDGAKGQLEFARQHELDDEDRMAYVHAANLLGLARDRIRKGGVST